MKKLLTLIITVVFIFTLSACGSTNSTDNNTQQNSGSATSPSQSVENSTPSQSVEENVPSDSTQPNNTEPNNSQSNNTQPKNTQQAEQSTQSNPKLTADEALNIALKQAGVTKDSIRNLENKLDRDDGILVYEIDFESGNTEYSYDINAETGAIIDRDRDRED